ncbi:MAG TPA: Holliday junction resolvase RuvX [Clostridiales bacterium]|nr:Holliday junction resolvase RuvX [Clostridiales bacterium]HQH62800.1 Holliday junction resolvase RuvX [Clostridiales bacterium]HQK73518.1 Holliday junction resolvase RuvX [Clostridiales bacterium]
MVILSVDYGESRTGIAVCDATEMLASPVCVINEKSRTKLIAAISDLAKARKAGLILVGLPLNMDASHGSRAEKSRQFAQLLEQHSGIQTQLWDERLTSVSANAQLSAAGIRGEKRKEKIDAVAAAMLLDDYIRYRKNRAESRPVAGE